MKKVIEPVTIDKIKRTYESRSVEIKQRLADFENVRHSADDGRIWEEMVFCFFTGGCSAKMGLRSVEAVRPLLINGSQPKLAKALTGVHRYPNARSKYIVQSREFIVSEMNWAIKAKLDSFECRLERRDWLVSEKGIKGLGYKEASHFLRNIGYKGYAILDKHVLNCLAELKIINDPKPPNSRARYLSTEEKLEQLTSETGIDLDEMDLVLWSMKTGEILK